MITEPISIHFYKFQAWNSLVSCNIFGNESICLERSEMICQ